MASGTLRLDTKYALRTLRRRPLFTIVAVITLGIGIGSATAMFSVVNGVLLADLEYRQPDRLATIWQRVGDLEGVTADRRIRLMYSQYVDLVDRTTVFDDVALYAADWGETTLTGGVRPELVQVGAASASLLSTLGIEPLVGRWFGDDEDGNGAGNRSQVAVLSYHNWTVRYGGGRDVLGRTVILDERPYTVIGVLPPGFRMQWLTASLSQEADPGPRDFWVPIGSPNWREGRGSTQWEAVGRLSDGVNFEQAAVETGAILGAAWDGQDAEAVVLPRAGEEIRGVRSPLILLFGATGLLLLIACGNIAALSLGEVQGRLRETVTRTALGAGRGRIVRQLLTESVLLGAAGSVVGGLIAVAGTGVLVRIAPPIPRIANVTVDLRVLAFAALVGVAAGMVFGLVPAFVSARSADAMLRGGERAGSTRHSSLGRMVVAGEVAMTVMLVVTGGLLVKSLDRLLRVDPGFDSSGVALVGVSISGDRYGSDGVKTDFMRRVIARLEALPGVVSATAANDLPFPGRSSGWGMYRVDQSPESYKMPRGYHVAPEHLEFLGVPLVEGRTLVGSDGPEAPPVMVVNRALARSLWGDRSPIGEQVRYAGSDEPVTIVGIVEDVRQTTLHGEPPPTFYVSFAQHTRNEIVFATRTRPGSAGILNAMQEAVWAVDADLAITVAAELGDLIHDSASNERYRTILMSVFGVLASLLAAVGIFGVTARGVAHSIRELGIRKALGAPDRTLIFGVVRRGAVTGGAGVVLGLLGAAWASRLVAGFLYGVEPFDPVTFAAVASAFAIVSLGASYLPARRILRVDPVAVLKAD